MTMTYKTVSGTVTRPDSNIGIRAKVTVTPLSTNHALTFTGDDRITVGPVVVETASNGVLPALKIPTNVDLSGLVWRITAEAIDPIPGMPKRWTVKNAVSITGTGTALLRDLAEVDVLTVDATVVASVSDYASAADASKTAAAGSATTAAGWADAAASSAADADTSADLADTSADTATTAASTATTKATEASTSATTATTKASEAAASASHAEDMAGAAEAVAVSNDTIIAGRINDPASATATALTASFDQRGGTAWATGTAYKWGQIVVNPSGVVVVANVDHTASASYTTDAAKWDTLGPSVLFALRPNNGKRPVGKDELVVNVADYGAVGDGVTDDTAAIKRAIAAAGVGGTVWFPAAKTFKTTSEITPLARQLWWGYGATIKRADQVTTTTTTAITSGNNGKVLSVASVAGFAVGMTVTVTTGPNNTDGCYAAHKITAIDPAAKTLTVDTVFTKTMASGGTVVTHHGIITSPPTISGSSALGVKGGDGGTADYADDIHIRGLKIDGNRGNNTAYTAWQTNASISLYSDGGSIQDCRLVDNQADGIIAGGQGMNVTRNIILRSGGNGIHLSGMGGGKVTLNYVKDATLAITGTDNNSGPAHAEGCMTWSSDIIDTLVADNYFENGRTIFGGIAGADNRGNIIQGNKGIGATLYAVEGRDNNGTAASPHFGSIVLIGNRFESCGPIEFNNPAGNTASELLGTPPDRVVIEGNECIDTRINLVRAKNVVCVGNHLEWTTTLVAGMGLIEVNRCINAKVRDNVIIGGAYGVAVTSTAPAATKWFRAASIDVSGNTFHNQNLSAVITWGSAGYAHRSCQINDNVITTDVTQNSGYVGITATSGVVVRDNLIDVFNGRGVQCGGDSSTSPVGVPGTVVEENTIHSPSDSVRITAGTINNVVRRNHIDTAVNNAAGDGNTVENNLFMGVPKRMVQALAANGAVTFDAKSEQQRVDLAANATSSTIAVGYRDQPLTITWRQDATGGRTYVWPTACRFAGGTAPSDTTASTQTSVTFEYNSVTGHFVETSRTVAVPI